MLIVQSLSAGAQKAPFRGNQRAFAHVVALCLLTLRKERTLAMRLDFNLEWQTGSHLPWSIIRHPILVR